MWKSGHPELTSDPLIAMAWEGFTILCLLSTEEPPFAMKLDCHAPIVRSLRIGTQVMEFGPERRPTMSAEVGTSRRGGGLDTDFAVHRQYFSEH